jgi:drug/metabolite transporter (DMT)-like permease
MTLHLGILLALLCAVGSNLAFFFKHRGACEACAVDIKHPLRTAKSLWSSKWFAGGMVIGAGAWGLHVAAISLAPLSVVQAVLAGGVALLAVMADKLFGMKVGPRQWWGLALTATGLILLGVTLPGGHHGGAAFSMPAMIAFEAGSSPSARCSSWARASAARPSITASCSPPPRASSSASATSASRR